MKKIISLLLCVIMVLTFAACGDSAEEGQVFDGADTAAKPAVEKVDLTALSSTMVYSEVSQMMTAPEKYVGKMVKMAGT